MSTKHCIVLLYGAVFFITVACNRPNYKACFTTGKDTIIVGETIWFFNCSDFDGSSGLNSGSWTFDPDQTDLILTYGHDSISWVYTTPGVNTTKLKIGSKELGSEASKQIVVNP